MFGFKEKIKKEEKSVVTKSVLSSLFFTILILFVVFSVIYVNRGAVLGYFMTEYIQEKTGTVEKDGEKVVSYLRENSRVVEVVNEAISSVVSVVISKKVPVLKRERSIGPFGFPQSRIYVEGAQRRRVGAGSGVIVSKDGLVVTNKHVVSSRKAEYDVITANGERYNTEVIARDPFIDIALLKIQSNESFDPLSFGDSEVLQLGQKVIAIGNALGEFQNTVSVGVVSGLLRSILAEGQMGTERLEQVIQTDAALNPGNSGGPLLSLSGRVIGVNVAVAGEGENIAFAIPSELVKSIVETVKKTGEVTRPFIGVRYIPVSRIPESSNLPVEHGALIFSGTPGVPAIVSNSPAANAGLEVGDVILAVDGEAVTRAKSLGFLIRMKSVGEKVAFWVFRDGKQVTIPVVLGELTNDVPA